MLLCEVIDQLCFEKYSGAAKLISSFLKSYAWLTDAFVLDFFIDSHWQRLPIPWQMTFQDMELSSLADFISLDSQKGFQDKSVLPLSLLAFRASVQLLSLEREPPKNNTSLVSSINRIRRYAVNDEKTEVDVRLQSETERNPDPIVGGQQLPSLDQNLRRCVKPKKQHEILRLAEVIQFLIKDRTSCQIVDVGSGQGHLSRFLSFGCGYSVVTIEGEESHIAGAKILDDKVMNSARKKDRKLGKCVDEVLPVPSPQHIVHRINKNADVQELEDILGSISNDCADSRYLLVGLHTCGNLATSMLKLLAESKAAVGIVSVACCYMKLDTESHLSNETFSGYPMSRVVRSVDNHQLSYEAREVACHAIELYQQKLKDNASALKIHCYRATLEVLIVEHYPMFRRLGLRSVKRAECMSFVDYAMLALDRKDLKIPLEDLNSPIVSDCMSQWRRVIIFYSLRLFLAPVIETLILIDRVLYLYENDIHGLVMALFDPRMSPRNHVLLARRKP